MTDRIDPSDLDNLRHMVGASGHIARRNRGHRNYYCAGPSDIPSMERLIEAGLVVFMYERQGDPYYRATREGAIAAGLTGRHLERAMGVPR